MFNSGANQAARQAALDSVGGTSVGGWVFSSPEGLYAIQVVDSGNGSVFQSYIEKLRALSQVVSATPVLAVDASYLRPNDGSGWQAGSWNVRPTGLSTSPRWALEAIAAPLAWGCSVGSTLPKIVIADQNFDPTEIGANLATSLPQSPVGDTLRHGTSMANIIAARGNDSIGMTGVMWRASLTPVQMLGSGGKIKDVYGSMRRMHAEVGQGTVIVNLSVGVPWKTLPGQGALTLLQDSVNLAKVFENIGLNLQGSPNALYVVAAGNLGRTGPQGNDSLSAWWSGFPQLASWLPGQTIVVGASTLANAKAVFSSLGSLPDIYAPGADVHTYRYSGGSLSIGADSGASHATAYVTGVAGLLASFDSSLTGPEIRNLIIAGADSGNRSISGTSRKLLNAYEALKAAARRPGAPLCGNAVWSVGSEIHVERSSGAAVLLNTGSPTPILGISTFHGGKSVGYWYSEYGGLNFRGAVYNGSSWVGDVDYPSDIPSSMAGYGHALGAWAFAEINGGQYVYSSFSILHADTLNEDGVEIAEFSVPPVPGGQMRCIFSGNTLDSLGEPNGRVCHEEVDIVDYAAGQMAWDPYPAIAYHPMGDTILVTMPYVRIQGVDSINAGCAFGAGPPLYYACPVAIAYRRVDSTTVFRILKTGAGSPVRLWSQPGLIARLDIAEEGQGRLVSVVHQNASIRIGLSVTGYWVPWQTSSCSVEFRTGYSATPYRTISTGCSTDLGSIAPVGPMTAQKVSSRRRP